MIRWSWVVTYIHLLKSRNRCAETLILRSSSIGGEKGVSRLSSVLYGLLPRVHCLLLVCHQRISELLQAVWTYSKVQNHASIFRPMTMPRRNPQPGLVFEAGGRCGGPTKQSCIKYFVNLSYQHIPMYTKRVWTEAKTGGMRSQPEGSTSCRIRRCFRKR